MFASFAYEREIEGEIMNRCNLHGQQLFGFEEMVDISARINLIYTAFALRVERRKVGGPLGIAEIDNALPSNYLPIAAIARSIGADIMMAFDECPPGTASYEYARKSLTLTHNWLRRCVQRFVQTEPRYGYHQSLFPIVQK